VRDAAVGRKFNLRADWEGLVVEIEAARRCEFSIGRCRQLTPAQLANWGGGGYDADVR